jgi:uncharacterized protein (TIGR03067 family)
MSAVLIGLALTLGAPATKDTPKKDVPTIVGEWVGEKAITGGKEKPVPEGGIDFTFTEDGKLMVREGTRNDAASNKTGSYKIDSKKTPAEIDIIPPADKKEATIQGIYKIEGDTLTLCISHDADRPTKFESPAGAKTMVMVLKRAKKE